MYWTTEHERHPCQFLVNGKWEPDGFACMAKPYCPVLYPTFQIWRQRKEIAAAIC